MVAIKICGLKYATNISQVIESGVPYLGFIFYKKSPRYVQSELSNEFMTQIPSEVQKVGVFVNETIDRIISQVDEFSLTAVQLHGAESPSYVQQLRERAPRLVLFKAFAVNSVNDLSAVRAYSDIVDFVLFDTKTEQYGGSGKVFDWSVLDEYSEGPPFFLSGGLGVDNAKDAANFVRSHPLGQGLDANSCLEEAPGLKSIRLVNTFISEVNNV